MRSGSQAADRVPPTDLPQQDSPAAPHLGAYKLRAAGDGSVPAPLGAPGAAILRIKRAGEDRAPRRRQRLSWGLCGWWRQRGGSRQRHGWRTTWQAGPQWQQPDVVGRQLARSKGDRLLAHGSSFNAQLTKSEQSVAVQGFGLGFQAGTKACAFSHLASHQAGAAGGQPPRQIWGGPPAAAPNSPCTGGIACRHALHRHTLMRKWQSPMQPGHTPACEKMHPSHSPHQLHIGVQAGPACGVWARQRLAWRHLWPPAPPDDGAHLQP